MNWTKTRPTSSLPTRKFHNTTAKEKVLEASKGQVQKESDVLITLLESNGMLL